MGLNWIDFSFMFIHIFFLLLFYMKSEEFENVKILIILHIYSYFSAINQTRKFRYLPISFLSLELYILQMVLKIYVTKGSHYHGLYSNTWPY